MNTRETRSCGTCTACCKTHSVSGFTFEKPAGKWCQHCTPGKGCKIYEDRPRACVLFKCSWLKGIGEEDDRPDRRKVVLDAVYVAGGPPEGYLQMWEVSEGALRKPWANAMARLMVAKGAIVTHIYSSGRKKIFLPKQYSKEDFSFRKADNFEIGDPSELR
ncbi:MAG: hypothetical protein WDN10_01025 [bacterium]